MVTQKRKSYAWDFSRLVVLREGGVSTHPCLYKSADGPAGACTREGERDHDEKYYLNSIATTSALVPSRNGSIAVPTPLEI
jgi:hypothetical protein